MLARLSRCLGGDAKRIWASRVPVARRDPRWPGAFIEGEWDVVAGVEMELEIWHPKSMVGRKVTLYLSDEDARDLLTGVRDALRDLRSPEWSEMPDSPGKESQDLAR
jgi:hypothetical protein